MRALSITRKMKALFVPFAPSLILPANPNQVLVAHKRWGSGGACGDREPARGHLAWKEITPAQIQREIDSLIANQDCARTCAAFRREIEACGGAEGAVDILEDDSVRF